MLTVSQSILDCGDLRYIAVMQKSEVTASISHGFKKASWIL